MIKLLTIGLLLFVLYRLFTGNSLLKSGNSTQHTTKQEPDNDEYVDYEEVD